MLRSQRQQALREARLRAVAIQPNLITPERDRASRLGRVQAVASFRDKGRGLGAGVVAQAQHVELAEIDVLPEHRFVVIRPVHLDIPDAAFVVFIEFDIGGRDI